MFLLVFQHYTVQPGNQSDVGKTGENQNLVHCDDISLIVHLLKFEDGSMYSFRDTTCCFTAFSHSFSSILNNSNMHSVSSGTNSLSF